MAHEMLGVGVTARGSTVNMHAHGGGAGTVKWDGRQFR
jgi:hypothetical protein